MPLTITIQVFRIQESEFRILRDDKPFSHSDY